MNTIHITYDNQLLHWNKELLRLPKKKGNEMTNISRGGVT